MAREPEPEAGEGGGERWLVSYADFITLLFAFFVVMFANSQSDPDKAEQFGKSMQSAFKSYGIFMTGTGSRDIGIDEGAGGIGSQIIVEISSDLGLEEDEPWEISAASANEEEAWDEGGGADAGEETWEEGGGDDVPPPEDTGDGADGSGGAGGGGADAELFNDLTEMFKDNAHVNLIQEQRGTVIRLGEAGLFDSGSAVLKPNSLTLVDDIARSIHSLGRADVSIRIEGHTDNVPLNHPYGAIRNNRDLSYGRANNVALRFINQHQYAPWALIPSAYGDTRPIASNSTADGRARNRRVDIVVLSEQYEKFEPTHDASIR